MGGCQDVWAAEDKQLIHGRHPCITGTSGAQGVNLTMLHLLKSGKCVYCLKSCFDASEWNMVRD